MMTCEQCGALIRYIDDGFACCAWARTEAAAGRGPFTRAAERLKAQQAQRAAADAIQRQVAQQQAVLDAIAAVPLGVMRSTLLRRFRSLRKAGLDAILGPLLAEGQIIEQPAETPWGRPAIRYRVAPGAAPTVGRKELAEGAKKHQRGESISLVGFSDPSSTSFLPLPQVPLPTGAVARTQRPGSGFLKPIPVPPGSAQPQLKGEVFTTIVVRGEVIELRILLDAWMPKTEGTNFVTLESHPIERIVPAQQNPDLQDRIVAALDRAPTGVLTIEQLRRALHRWHYTAMNLKAALTLMAQYGVVVWVDLPGQRDDSGTVRLKREES